MEKMTWTRPVAVVEQFMPNEYIAACWSIECNVPSGTGYYEKNGYEGYQRAGDWIRVDGQLVQVRASDEYIASGSGCGEAHVASGISAAGPHANAKWEDRSGNVYDVFHFYLRSSGNQSDHFCTLDEVVWDPRPNASN